MKICPFAAMAALGIALSGCATIIEGSTQSVSINTTPEQGAECALTNSQGTWYLTSPGSTSVHKTKTDLDITCKKPGFEPGHLVAASHFGATTVGNVIAGGGIGLVVDAESGANYHYDSPIVVPLGTPASAATTGGTPTAAPTIPVTATPSPAPSAPANPAGK